MKTMLKLINRFHKLHPDYKASFGRWESYKGYYVVYIQEPVLGLTHKYTFESCREFREWMDGVVLD